MSLDSLPPVTCAAVSTAFLMYPVDVVRALAMSSSTGPSKSVFQLVTEFYGVNGMSGFISKGLAAEMMRATVSRVIKFWAQPIAHQSVYGINQKEGTPFTKGLAGALATVPEVLLISPFENVKLAQQLDTKKQFNNTRDTFRHLIKTRGVAGLYIGYLPMQIRQGLWTGGYFMSLDVFKGYTEMAMGSGVMSTTIAGFMAGVFGTTLNCWSDVCRTQIQKTAINKTFDKSVPKPRITPGYLLSSVSDLTSAVSRIYTARGIGGLYAGYMIKSCYLGGSGALLAVLVPFFKQSFGVENT